MSTTNPEVRETEWDSLQRKFGNLPPLPPRETEEQLTRRAVNAAESIDTLAHKSLRELANLEDDVDEDILEKYRRRRIAEIRRKKQLERFGEVYHVGKDDFVSEVTQTGSLKGSSNCGGTWVVVHVYRDSVPASEALNNILPEVARRHKEVKFVKARAEDVIPDYPDNKIPTVLLYRGGSCLTQLIGRQREWGAEKATIAKFEKVL
ncbi:phosducin-like protein 2, partial [Dama dama]|uniref:phosducin-like protein 2 n=1 Tax=Dama dama TaxID=30532 RepID=UPI002A3601B9